MRLLLLLTLLNGCLLGAKAPCVDADRDGFGDLTEDCSTVSDLEPDCDDADPDVHPDADELCDGADNNCDDRVDEDCDTAE